MGAGRVGRGPAACEGAGHVLETPCHQWDRQPGKIGFQVLFSAAWVINLKVCNLLQGENWGALCISCWLCIDFLQLLEFLT